MRILPHIILSLFVCFVFSVPAFALDLGENITIPDGNSSSDSGWYGPDEDDEVEPGMVGNQVWDLEGFFLDQNMLSMVGGYNFRDGEGTNPTYFSGDIFLSTDDDDPQYGDIEGNDGTDFITSTYDYEYVLDLDFSTMTYVVFGLDDTTVLETAYYKENEGSSPWRYEKNGVVTGISGAFEFSELSPGDVSFSGDTHYLLDGFDLSFLGHGTEFYSHFTMECGNDNLMGQGTVVPEPSTFILFAVGGGLALWARRKQK